MNKTLEAEITQLHAEICAGLADPNRIMILYTLSQGPRNVTELCNELAMAQPLVSRHLKMPPVLSPRPPAAASLPRTGRPAADPAEARSRFPADAVVRGADD